MGGRGSGYAAHFINAEEIDNAAVFAPCDVAARCGVRIIATQRPAACGIHRRYRRRTSPRAMADDVLALRRPATRPHRRDERVLVTGANGFIGRVAVRHLADAGIRVRSDCATARAAARRGRVRGQWRYRSATRLGGGAATRGTRRTRGRARARATRSGAGDEGEYLRTNAAARAAWRRRRWRPECGASLSEQHQGQRPGATPGARLRGGRSATRRPMPTAGPSCRAGLVAQAAAIRRYAGGHRAAAAGIRPRRGRKLPASHALGGRGAAAAVRGVAQPAQPGERVEPGRPDRRAADASGCRARRMWLVSDGKESRRRSWCATWAARCCVRATRLVPCRSLYCAWQAVSRPRSEGGACANRSTVDTRHTRARLAGRRCWSRSKRRWRAPSTGTARRPAAAAVSPSW